MPAWPGSCPGPVSEASRVEAQTWLPELGRGGTSETRKSQFGLGLQCRGVEVGARKRWEEQAVSCSQMTEFKIFCFQLATNLSLKIQIAGRHLCFRAISSQTQEGEKTAQKRDCVMKQYLGSKIASYL